MCGPKAPPPTTPPPQAPMVLEQEAPTKAARRSESSDKRAGLSKYKIDKKGAASASLGGIQSMN